MNSSSYYHKTRWYLVALLRVVSSVLGTLDIQIAMNNKYHDMFRRFTYRDSQLAKKEIWNSTIDSAEPIFLVIRDSTSKNNHPKSIKISKSDCNQIKSFTTNSFINIHQTPNCPKKFGSPSQNPIFWKQKNRNVGVPFWKILNATFVYKRQDVVDPISQIEISSATVASVTVKAVFFFSKWGRPAIDTRRFFIHA